MIEDSPHLKFEVNLSKNLVFSVMIHIMDKGITFLVFSFSSFFFLFSSAGFPAILYRFCPRKS